MEESQQSPHEPQFDVDRPIESREQDLLGRGRLVESITKHILEVPADHGFTVAVVGEWGSGKSSVLNMVKESIEADSDSAAMVLQFNPWLFGSASDLVVRFFRELSIQLGKKGKEHVKAVVSALIELGKGLSPIVPVPGVSAAANAIGGLAEMALSEKSLLEQRDQLSSSLAHLESRVVVVIDDIDRLEPSETRELLRLVRLTSDLPNVVFLLAFDWQHVSRSLDNNPDRGSLYLEKIVQVKYDIPTVRQVVLRDMYIDRLNEMIAPDQVIQLDENVWQSVFSRIVARLFRNVRDVKRCLISLPAAIDAVGREVALADLLGLEAVRVLRPAIFQALKTNSRWLVHGDSVSVLGMSDEVRKEVLTKMLQEEQESPAVLGAVFEILFPATQGCLGGRAWGTEWMFDWRRDRRVACEDVIRLYLQAGLDAGALEHRVLEDLVASFNNEEELGLLLNGLDDDQLEEALERLEDYAQELPPEAILSSVPTLVNQFHRLSDRFAGAFGSSPRANAKRFVYRLLRRIQSRELLAKGMLQMLPRVTSLSGCLQLVGMAWHWGPPGTSLIDEEQAGELDDALAERLRMATVDQLVEEWDLAGLVMDAVEWLPDEKKAPLKSVLIGHLSDSRFVLTLLLTDNSYSTRNGHVEKRLAWDRLIEALGEDLKSAVAELSSSSICTDLTADEQAVVELAQKYATGWRPPNW